MDNDQPTVDILFDDVWPEGHPIISIGPEKSGTQLMARAVLTAHNNKKKNKEKILPPYRWLSVTEMVNRLRGGEIDVACFTARVPSQAIDSVLNDSHFRLLSIDFDNVDLINNRVFTQPEIKPRRYACQRQNDKGVRTLATRAVLVAPRELEDVHTITKTIFEGIVYLKMDGGVEALATIHFQVNNSIR